VIEIVYRGAGHAEAFHDPPRLPILRHGDGDDPVEANPIEAETERRPRRFGGVAAAPIGARQPPGDLDRWGEMRFVRDPLQPDDPDEARLARYCGMTSGSAEASKSPLRHGRSSSRAVWSKTLMGFDPFHSLLRASWARSRLR
jgi:hypothetical protein